MSKEELRRKCPLVAAFVDDMRKHFGVVHVRYVRENGVEIDRRESNESTIRSA